MGIGVTARHLLIGFLVAAALVVAAAAWLWRPGGGGQAIDLVEMFPEAEKRTTMGSLHEAFRIEQVRIGDDSRLSIFAHPSSRITWKIVVPAGAVLETAYGLRPDAWTMDGDGVTFRIGLSDGSHYREFVKQWVDPYHRPEDRRWFPITIDLSPWTGREVEIIFNTEPNYNAVHDAAVWGGPMVRYQ